MPPNTRSSSHRSASSDRQIEMRANENTFARDSRKAPSTRSVLRGKDTGATASRTALSAVPQTNAYAQRTGGTAAIKTRSAGKPSTVAPAARITRKDPYTTARSNKMAAALDARKRVPLAPIEQARPQVYRDPSTSLVTASTSAVSSQQPRLRRLAAASALTSLASKSTSRPTKAVRSSSASSDAQLKHAYTSASDTERPAPLATRKRRANSVDTTAQQGRNVRARVESHERVVDQPTRYRTRLVTERRYEYFEPAADQEVKSYRRALGQKYEYRETVTDRDVDHHRRVASQKSELDAYSTTSVESRDSQTTVVDDALHGRRVARPSRAFASLHAARALSPFEDAPQAEEDATRAEDAAKSKENRDWDDLDADDEDDPMMVAEYIEDIIEYLREVEPRSMPDTAYMGKQMDLTWDMRRVLVNWIIQIHYQFRMLPETLFLAVNLIDRFLSKRHVSVAKLQLVGLTGLLIASKYEETTTPHIKDFRYLAGNCYTIEEILNAEFFMLCVLEFDMSYPNPMTFLRRVSKAEQYNIQSRTVAKYLMEVCLVDHRLMAFPPSHIAAAGICLARRMLHSGEWDANLRHFSGFEEAELQPCVDLMANYLLCARDDEFVFKKYMHRRFLRTSLFCREWVGRHRDEFELADPPIGTFAASSAAAREAANEAHRHYVPRPHCDL